MNAPRVESLEYKLATEPALIFERPTPLEHDTRDFKLRLDDGRLLVTMKRDCATEQEARDVVWPVLRAWELQEALERGRQELRFIFEKANVIDRQPTPGELSPDILAATFTAHGRATGTFHGAAVRRSYPPPPPATFVVSPDVETLWGRYEGYVLGREPLLAMGYFCLSAIEWRYGGRARQARCRAAQDLNIASEILNMLGTLTSERGDAATARKWYKPQLRPLTNAEARWIEDTLRVMIRRLAMIDGGQRPAEALSMADLPDLPDTPGAARGRTP